MTRGLPPRRPIVRASFLPQRADLRSRCQLGLIAALAARDRHRWRPLVGSVQRAVAALEGQFEQLLDLSRLEPAP